MSVILTYCVTSTDFFAAALKDPLFFPFEIIDESEG